ncbi:uncharacterized protein LOC121753105 [Salvia splendens]|uniref:uncharacterized protein LOC121753105 n=1 Tax=Salvia splendens TaxID=180675 RepID=UPI001C25B350|nr:uncharacterized protein LOC121753105 [Salvia splendens]
MSGRSEGSCVKQLKLSFTTWMAYFVPPFPARPEAIKLHRSVSAFKLSIRAAIVVERSLPPPSCSKTGNSSVISSSSTTPKAYTSTLGVTRPAPRHSGFHQEEHCCLLHHCAHELGLRSCGDREGHWQHQVQYACVGSSPSYAGILFCSASPEGSRLPCAHTRGLDEFLRFQESSLVEK